MAAAALGYGIGSHFAGAPSFREGLVTTVRPFSLDPLIHADDEAVHDVGHLLYRSLLRLDATAFPRPDLGTYTVSPDGLTARVVVVRAQRWSDGRPITTADVSATVRFAQSSLASDPAMAAQLRGVTVTVEADAVVFHLPAPRASFAATLTQLPILPLGALSVAALSRVAAADSVPLPTSGPYRVEAAGSSSILLAANPYAQPRPHMSTIELVLYQRFSDAAAAFSGGTVDAVLATTPAERSRLLAVRGARAHLITTFRFVDLLFNERAPGLDDTTVRRALSLALDRRRIAAGALAGWAGVPQSGAVSDGLRWVGSPPTAPGSAGGAASALQAAGWAVGAAGYREKDGQVLAFTLQVPDAAPLPTVAREVEAQLEAIGVHIDVNVVPSAGFLTATLLPRTFELAIADWDAAPDPDVSSFWRSNAVPPNGFNVSGGPTDPFLDQALDSLATSQVPQVRAAAALSVDRFLAADVPCAFLYTPVDAYVVREPLRGLTIPSTGGSAARFDTIAAWTPA